MTLYDIGLYRILANRNTDNGRIYAGLLLPIADDVNNFLQYIKNTFPSFPDHGLQHALRNLRYISEILDDNTLENMSDTEIFCLVLASLFHDTGMALITEKNNPQMRSQHHLFSSKVIEVYFNDKLSLLEQRQRIKAVVNFVCNAHGMDIKQLYSEKSFSRRDKISGDDVRYSLLAVLLRIGDLLDLEQSRSNEFALSYFSSIYNEEAKNHNIRHQLVTLYNYSHNSLEIEVLAENVEQYKIWHAWFEYLENDILRANTYLQEYLVHLPAPKTRILKADGADFDIQELRFEIDEKGGIWSILSKSIYTDEFDFIRELVQNAIDASLYRIYSDIKINIENISPRFWNAQIYCDDIIIGYSEVEKELIIIDAGIGMNQFDLKNFLFKVTGSGYSVKIRDFRFPGIAKFGLGFVSCLINANKIEIYTKKADEQYTHKVSLSDNSTTALIQDIHFASSTNGTIIRLGLKHKFSCDSILSYLIKTFIYTSVEIKFIDIDKLNIINGNISYNKINILNEPYNFRGNFLAIEQVRKLHIEPLLSKRSYTEDLLSLLEDLVDFVKDNSDNISDEKYADYRSKCRQIRAFIRQHELAEVIPDIGTIPDIARNISKNKNILYENVDYLDWLQNQINILENIKRNYDSQIRPLERAFYNLGNKNIDIGVDWNYCFITMDYDFELMDIESYSIAKDLSKKTGILFIRSKHIDKAKGIEFSTINGFLVRNGNVFQTISKYRGLSYSNHRQYDEYLLIGSVCSNNNTLDLLEDEIEDNEEEYMSYDEYGDLHIGQRIRKDYDVIFVDNNNFFVTHDLEIDESINLHYSNLKRDDSRPLLDILNCSKAFTKNDEFTVKLAEIMSIVMEEPAIYCQDGIRVFLLIDSLFPLGIIRINCNCTADSRFPLNVTRHNVSENRDDIDSWITFTGKYIQKCILEKLATSFRSLNLNMDFKEAISDITSKSDYLSTCAAKQLKELINAM